MITITRDAWRKFAPKAKPAYTQALFDGMDQLAKAGILDTHERWAHFIGQCAAETDGFTILRESLNYRTVRAVRNAWPARAKKHSDEWIAANLLGNPVALGDWAYGGREGNRKGTEDGFAFRGGGWLQTTHRNAVESYCRKLGVPVTNDVLDDVGITLRFAIVEWTECKCNALADRGDVLGISKAINTGSATSSVIPNGLDRRRKETARALEIWDGTQNAIDVPVAPTRPFPAVETPSAVTTAARSRSVQVLLAAMVAKLAAWGEAAFDLLPRINTEVDGVLAPLSSLAEHLKINIAGIASVVVVVSAALVIYRHTRDKQELAVLKGE